MDVLELLEKEKEYHLNQVEKINRAISAYKGDEVGVSRNYNKKELDSKPVPWTKLIKGLFNRTGEEFNLEQIQDEIARIGYQEAKTQAGKNAIYTTISRLINNYDYLEKTESGAFRKKIEKVARLDMNPK